jgi:hypothetical protein
MEWPRLEDTQQGQANPSKKMKRKGAIGEAWALSRGTEYEGREVRRNNSRHRNKAHRTPSLMHR